MPHLATGTHTPYTGSRHLLYLLNCHLYPRQVRLVLDLTTVEECMLNMTWFHLIWIKLNLAGQRSVSRSVQFRWDVCVPLWKQLMYRAAKRYAHLSCRRQLDASIPCRQATWRMGQTDERITTLLYEPPTVEQWHPRSSQLLLIDGQSLPVRASCYNISL